VAKTDLSLEVSDNPNTKVMRLFDTSFYCPDEAVENYLIEVLPVNCDRWITFNVKKGFSLVLNSSNLQYRKAASADALTPLRDGIYEIKQSIKPNLITLNHFWHFRITNLLGDIQTERHKLLSDKCDITREEYRINRDKLRDIEEYVKAAKWIVEEDHDKVKGKELYEYSQKLLDEYTNECKC
jgi:hypothetical protein